MEDKLFRYSLILSLLLHTLLLLRISYTNQHFLTKPIKSLEVVYPNFMISKKSPKPPQPLKGMKVDIEADIKPFKEEHLKDLKKDIPKISDNFLKQQEKPLSPTEKGTKRRVSVPALETQEIKNPLYLDYYQAVRSRIRDRAYANYEEFFDGEVYLTFIVDAFGNLTNIKIIEERTKANQYLRQISMKSVREAGPFPEFPEDLRYPELSFNVVISFEIE